MSYEREIRRRLQPLRCMTKTGSIVSIFDVLVKVTFECAFDIDEVTKTIEEKPYGPWFARVDAVHGQVVNVRLTTLPPAAAAPVPANAPQPLLPAADERCLVAA